MMIGLLATLMLVCLTIIVIIFKKRQNSIEHPRKIIQKFSSKILKNFPLSGHFNEIAAYAETGVSDPVEIPRRQFEEIEIEAPEFPIYAQVKKNPQPKET